MEDAERIQIIERHCRAYQYPETLVTAIVEYLSGQGSLEQMQQAWEADGKQHHPYALFVHTPILGEHLGALDKRLIDIGSVVDQLPWMFQAVGWKGPIKEMRDYLLSQGMSEERFLEYAAQALAATGYHQFFYYPSPAPLARMLLTYLPTYHEKMQSLFQDTPRHRLAFINLLLEAQPPDLDLVERLVEELEEESTSYSSILGMCAKMLLQADPTRFTGWARKVASASGGATEHSRRIALQALLQRDTAQHIDLAVEAARTPPANNGWWSAYLQCDGLKAAYKFDPAQYQPLVEELTLSPSRQVATTALGLLTKGAIGPIADTLKRCVEQGQPDAALAAAQALFKQPWEGQQEYAVAQLANQSKHIRAFAGAWLAKQGESTIDAVAPYLSHRSADIRLSAVQALLPIGGERATTLLFSRLDVEKAQQIRQAIIDGIGLPGFAGPEAASRAPTIQQLTAKSEQYRHYLPKQFLAWFDLDDAPALRWTTGAGARGAAESAATVVPASQFPQAPAAEGAPVPPNVLNYLLYLQSRTPDDQALHPEAQQALTLIETASAGPLALALYRGWLNDGAKLTHARLLPLISALADDRLVPHLRRQIEEWAPTNRRKLAASLLRVLAQMESESAHAEIKSFTKLFKRGYMRRAAKAALELAQSA